MILLLCINFAHSIQYIQSNTKFHSLKAQPPPSYTRNRIKHEKEEKEKLTKQKEININTTENNTKQKLPQENGTNQDVFNPFVICDTEAESQERIEMESEIEAVCHK